MADPKKNPLIGAFRSPTPGSTPVTSSKGESKTAPSVPDTAPKAAEPPKDTVPKDEATATTPTTLGVEKKLQEPPEPEKPSTGEAAKSIDTKKGSEASKAPAEAKKLFREIYRHGEAFQSKDLKVELVAENTAATKDQELEALEKIKAIVESLGPDSYVGTAF